MAIKIHLIPRTVYDAVIVGGTAPIQIGHVMTKNLKPESAKRWKANNELVGYEVT